MSRSRGTRTTILLVLALLASCTAPTDPGIAGSFPGQTSPSPSTSKQPRSSASRTSKASPGSTAGGSVRPGTAAQPYRDRGGVGEMAKVYLRASPARRLVVEIDFVVGRRPGDAVLGNLATILERELRKPDGITIDVDDEIPAERDTYTFEQIEALEAEHRDRASGGSVATLYLLFLNGDLAGEEGTLGVSYRASAAAVFVDRVRSAATALVQAGAIERAVVVHEVGHLLALVNIGYKSRYDHEDAGHPKHSKYKESVMYWAIEDVSVVSILSGGPPADFDRFDRADLEDLRG